MPEPKNHINHIGRWAYRLAPDQNNHREVAFAEQWQHEQEQSQILSELVCMRRTGKLSILFSPGMEQDCELTSNSTRTFGVRSTASVAKRRKSFPRLTNERGTMEQLIASADAIVRLKEFEVELGSLCRQYRIALCVDTMHGPHGAIGVIDYASHIDSDWPYIATFDGVNKNGPYHVDNEQTVNGLDLQTRPRVC